MVAYYLWPPLALALVAACRDWARLLATGSVAVLLTFFSQVQWRNPWAWWTPMVAGLALALVFAWARPGARAAPQVLPEPGEQFAADGSP
jgi:energy-coupling factor transporter transmembrane protein EcfT